MQDLRYRAAAGILTPHLWVIQIPGSEGRSSLLSSHKWLFFSFWEEWGGQTEADTEQYTQPFHPDTQTQHSTYLHLLIETCLPVAGESKCVSMCAPAVIHSIRMLQHTHAVHCQRCPLCDSGQPWSLHYHINYIHVVAAVDWWYCYGFYTLAPHWKQWK